MERYVCWTEDALIKKFKAGIQDPSAQVDWSRARPSHFLSRDGKTINGLVWKANEPKGYVLVAQGTSMIAAEIYRAFEPFTSLGLDVYLYDFRGYGMSVEGNTALTALMSDYAQRISELNAVPEYRYHFVYGLSLGGILLTNAVQNDNLSYTGLVLDSVPDAIPWYAFCPGKFDPAKLLPAECKAWMVISGGDDRVVGSKAETLMRKAKSCGAETSFDADAGHIFTDSEASTVWRLGLAKRFFCTKMGGDCHESTTAAR